MQQAHIDKLKYTFTYRFAFLSAKLIIFC